MILSGKDLIVYRMNKVKEVAIMATIAFTSVISIVSMMIAF